MEKAMNVSHDHKSLTVRLTALREERSQKQMAIAESQKLLTQLNKMIQSVEDEIRALSRRHIVVSEHAMLRYLERVKGIDLEEISREIIGAIGVSGNVPDGLYPVDENFSIRIKANTVVTVLNTGLR